MEANYELVYKAAYVVAVFGVLIVAKAICDELKARFWYGVELRRRAREAQHVYPYGFSSADRDALGL